MVTDLKGLNLHAGQGVALREAMMAPGHGRADYLLFVDQRPVGVIEAKLVGTPLSGVEWQSAMYAAGLSAEHRLRAATVDGRLPFVIEASGTETPLTNGYDPEPRARREFSVPGPETLARIILVPPRAERGDPRDRAVASRAAVLPVAGADGPEDSRFAAPAPRPAQIQGGRPRFRRPLPIG